MSFHVPNQHRLRSGSLGSDDSLGNAGFFIWIGPIGRDLRAMASCGAGWERVSVSLDNHGKNIPTWLEMCHVKDLFWDAEDTVMQLHPPRSEYINHHPGCLHLWRPTGAEIPRPPTNLVGPRA